MRQFFKSVDWYVKISFIFGILLLIAGFLFPWPPNGEISGSILAGVGELDTFTTIIVFLYKLPEYIEKSGQAKIKKGDLEIEFTNTDKKDE